MNHSDTRRPRAFPHKEIAMPSGPNPYTVRLIDCDGSTVKDGVVVGPGVEVCCVSGNYAQMWADRLNYAYALGRASVLPVKPEPSLDAYDPATVRTVSEQMLNEASAHSGVDPLAGERPPHTVLGPGGDYTRELKS